MKLWLYIVAVVAIIGIVPLGWWCWEKLWNMVVPVLFHGPRINFWQSAAICVMLAFVGGIIRAGKDD